MNHRKRDLHDPELEVLYRQAGDVEPEAGLDRIVRARAEQTRRERAPSGRLPWLGGLVTASVAVVAIAVVLQQIPPGESGPETIGPTELREPEAFMAPSVAARAEREESRAADRAGKANGKLQSATSRQARAAPDLAPSAPESEAATQQGRSRRARDNDTEQQDDIAVERYRAISAEIADDPDRMLNEIRDLLDKGETRQARELLARLRANHSNYTVPEEIVKALAQPD